MITKIRSFASRYWQIGLLLWLGYEFGAPVLLGLLWRHF